MQVQPVVQLGWTGDGGLYRRDDIGAKLRVGAMDRYRSDRISRRRLHLKLGMLLDEVFSI
jgi:hypothetical protein